MRNLDLRLGLSFKHHLNKIKIKIKILKPKNTFKAIYNKPEAYYEKLEACKKNRNGTGKTGNVQEKPEMP